MLLSSHAVAETSLPAEPIDAVIHLLLERQQSARNTLEEFKVQNKLL